jgi:hypothetical protein
VRHLRRSLAYGYQAASRQHLEHTGRPVVARDIELVGRHAPPDDRIALLGAREPDQDAAGDSLLVFAQTPVRFLGEPRDRSVDASGSLIYGQVHAATLAVLPQLHERSGEKRQAAGLLGDVIDERPHEVAVHNETRYPRGLLDRARELVPLHRTDEHVALTQQAGQPRVGRAGAVVVRPYR